MNDDDTLTTTDLWTYHNRYRRAIRSATRLAFKAIGFDGRCEVLLAGIPLDDHTSTVTVVPYDKIYAALTSDAVSEGADRLLEQAVKRDRVYALSLRDSRLKNAQVDRLRGYALAHELRRLDAARTWYFTASRSVVAAELRTHVVLAVEAEPLVGVPALPLFVQRDSTIQYSLVHSLMDEIVARAWAALRVPTEDDPVLPLQVSTTELVRGAAARLIGVVFERLGGRRETKPDALLNAISALPYEGRPGSGTLILAAEDDSAVEVNLRLTTGVNLGERRTVRKLIEASNTEIGLLVDERGMVNGLGRVRQEHDRSPLRVSFIERGAWDLIHAGRALLSVRDGEARLPAASLDEATLRDTIEWLLPGAATDRLIALAHAAGRHNHGAMLVISGAAESEAARLFPQCITVQPMLLSPQLLTQLTDMDGAVLIDPQGWCHAVGVILDGQAAGQGDPSRGSRFNNPIRYLGDERPNAVILVYSSDGGVDIMPELHIRVSREEVAAAVIRYVDLIEAQSPDFDEIFEARDDVERLEFYLSGEQCAAGNLATDALRERCREEGRPFPQMREFIADPAMNDNYWLPSSQN